MLNLGKAIPACSRRFTLCSTGVESSLHAARLQPKAISVATSGKHLDESPLASVAEDTAPSSHTAGIGLTGGPRDGQPFVGLLGRSCVRPGRRAARLHVVPKAVRAV